MQSWKTQYTVHQWNWVKQWNLWGSNSNCKNARVECGQRRVHLKLKNSTCWVNESHKKPDCAQLFSIVLIYGVSLYLYESVVVLGCIILRLTRLCAPLRFSTNCSVTVLSCFTWSVCAEDKFHRTYLTGSCTSLTVSAKDLAPHGVTAVGNEWKRFQTSSQAHAITRRNNAWNHLHVSDGNID